MTLKRSSKRARTMAWLVAFLLSTLAAQAGNPSQSFSAGQGSGFAYDPAKETTVVGTIKEFVTHPVPGTPVGLHILISASGETVDVHLGPYLAKDIQEALKTAPMVQVVGSTASLHGKEILLARELVFSGRQVTIRNERGFLIRQRVLRRGSSDNKPAPNGGAQ